MAFDPVTAGLELAKQLTTTLGKWIPDATKAQEAAMEVAQQTSQQIQGQIAINMEEAKSASVFVAGWRPYLGWVCGAAFTWHFMVEPVALFILWVINGMVGPAPLLDWSQLSVVLGGLLGLGMMRSYDKKQGTS